MKSYAALALLVVISSGCTSLTYEPKSSARANIAFVNESATGEARVVVYDNENCQGGKMLRLGGIKKQERLDAAVDSSPLFTFAANIDRGTTTKEYRACVMYSRFRAEVNKNYQVRILDDSSNCRVEISERTSGGLVPVDFVKLAYGPSPSAPLGRLYCTASK